MPPAKVLQPKTAALPPLLLAAALAVTGCQGVLPPPVPPPYQGVEVRVACPDPALAAFLTAHSRAWQGRQEATVVVTADRAAADVWVLPPADVGRFGAAAQLLPVPPPLQERGAAFTWAGLLPVYREQLLSWDRTACALPLVGEAPVLLYRADLFASPDLQKKFDTWKHPAKDAGVPFRPPASWQELAALAEFFRDHHPSGKPAPSLPPLPAAAEDLDRLFFQVAASLARRGVRLDEPQTPENFADIFSFHYDVETGKPRIDAPGFVAALELLARLQACRPDGTLPDPVTAFLDGQAVFALTNASALIEVQKRPPLRDKVGVTAVPGSQVYYDMKGAEQRLKDSALNRVPYLGGAGWLAVVPKSAKNPQAAWDLLADLAGPARSMQMALEPRWGGPVRSDQVMRERWDAFDLEMRGGMALKDAVARTMMQHGLKNPALCLRTPDADAHRQLLDAALVKVLQGKAVAKDALPEVARGWAKLDAAKGTDATRAEYRISLGLSGK